MKRENMEQVFSGWTPTGKRVDVLLEDEGRDQAGRQVGHLRIVYTESGCERRWNGELYDEDSDFYGMLTLAGFKGLN